MTVESGILIGSLSSLATIIVTKFKCLIKKNGVWTSSCAFMDKPIVPDDDEIEVKQFDLGENVKGLYVRPKHQHLYTHEEHNIDSSDSE